MGAWLTGAVAICTAGYTIFNGFIYPSLKKGKEFCKLALKTVKDASQIHEIIRTELSTDNGWSLKDTLSRIEKKMFVQDNKHRAMLSLLERPVWEADENGMFVWVNRAFVKALGRDIGDLKNSGWISIIHPDDRERVNAEWNSCVAQTRVFSARYKMIKQNGDVLDCTGEAFPVESVDHIGEGVSKKGFVGILSARKI
jgi:PAS domain S-box-containing protein